MLRTETELLTMPTGGEALAEQRAEWDRRRRTWEAIRGHEAQARCHELLAEEHCEAAIKLLEEVSA